MSVSVGGCGSLTGAPGVLLRSVKASSWGLGRRAPFAEEEGLEGCGGRRLEVEVGGLRRWWWWRAGSNMRRTDGGAAGGRWENPGFEKTSRRRREDAAGWRARGLERGAYLGHGAWTARRQ